MWCALRTTLLLLPDPYRVMDQDTELYTMTSLTVTDLKTLWSSAVYLTFNCYFPTMWDGVFYMCHLNVIEACTQRHFGIERLICSRLQTYTTIGQFKTCKMLTHVHENNKRLTWCLWLRKTPLQQINLHYHYGHVAHADVIIVVELFKFNI